MALKVAILISGFVRHHDLPSLRQHIVLPNVARGTTVDVYASVWSTVGIRVPVRNVDAPHDDVLEEREFWSGSITRLDDAPLNNTEFEQALAALDASSFKVQYNNYSELAAEWDNTVNMAWHFEHGKSKHQVLSKRGMWFGIQSAYKMIKEPYEYDFLIRTRPDLTFFQNGPVVLSRTSVGVEGRVYDLYLFDTEPRTDQSTHVNRIASRILGKERDFFETNLLVPVRSNGYIDDMVALGVPAAMHVYCNTYDSLNSILDTMFTWPEPLESESIVVYQALTNDVNLLLYPLNFGKSG